MLDQESGELWTLKCLIFAFFILFSVLTNYNSGVSSEHFLELFYHLSNTELCGQAHFHMLRHTAATMMLERGEPIKRVSEMLGHSSIAITGDIYQHIAPAGRRHAALTLGAALFGSE